MPGQRIALLNSLHFTVSGSGTCKVMRVDWGDGTQDDYQNVDLTVHPHPNHTFRGWGGGRTVTVIGIDGCEGRVSTRFKIEPVVSTFAFAQPGPNVCNPVGGGTLPPLVVQTLVHITATSISFDRTGRGDMVSGIDFCRGGCNFDADGKPGSVAASSFPFPGLREFSLVLKAGTPAVQGGTNAQFTTTEAGPLEICINDYNLSDNLGGLQIEIRVDQLGPSPPP
jgi:hypothetical protein